MAELQNHDAHTIHTAQTTHTTHQEPEEEDYVTTWSVTSILLRLIPLLLISIAAILGYQYCSRQNAGYTDANNPRTNPEQASTSRASETSRAFETAASTAAASTSNVDSRLNLINEGGRVRVTGVVPDEPTRNRIVNDLRASLGDNLITDITVNTNARPAPWFNRVGELTRDFSAAREAEISLTNNSIDVRGRMEASERASLIERLRALSKDMRINALALNSDGTINVEEAVREANLRTAEALNQLPNPFSGAQLTEALNLNIINFATASAEIPQVNQEILNKAADAIKRLPQNARLEIGGHSDNVGTQQINQPLSLRRAEAVRNYLIARGVNPDIVTAQGYADAKPVMSNDTEEGRFRNRRIEFTVSPDKNRPLARIKRLEAGIVRL